jgi:hypothetical protein
MPRSTARKKAEHSPHVHHIAEREKVKITYKSIFKKFMYKRVLERE